MFRIGLDRDISNSIAIRYTYYMRNAIVNAHFGTDVATRCSIHISSHWSWQWCQPGSMHICIETQQAYIYSDGALRARKYSLALWRGSFAVCPKSIRAKRLVVRVLVARTSEMWVYFMFVHRVWGLCWLVGGLWLKCEAPRLAINLPNKNTSWPICVRCCLILLHMDVCTLREKTTLISIHADLFVVRTPKDFTLCLRIPQVLQTYNNKYGIHHDRPSTTGDV